MVLFSAAIPQQGGVGHINERWPSYWAGLFDEHGYGAFDLVRPAVWTDDRVEIWYRQNLLVFAKGHATSTRMLDIVHPLLLERGLPVKGPKERYVLGHLKRLRRRLGR